MRMTSLPFPLLLFFSIFAFVQTFPSVTNTSYTIHDGAIRITHDGSGIDDGAGTDDGAITDDGAVSITDDGAISDDGDVTENDVTTAVRVATEDVEEHEIRVGQNSTEIISVGVPDNIDVNETVIIEFEIVDVEVEDDDDGCEGQIDILKCWMESQTGGDIIDDDPIKQAANTSSGNIHFSVGFAQNHLKDFIIFVNGSKTGSLCLKSLLTAKLEDDSAEIEGSGEALLNLVITSNINATKIIKIGTIYNSHGTCQTQENREIHIEEEYDLNVLLPGIEESGNFSVCSTDSGATCVFPFIWEGVEYSGCIPGAQGKDWCSTKVDTAGVHIQGYSAICKPQCPFDTMGYFFGQTGLSEIQAYIQQWGGTDDEVGIELSHGWEDDRCQTSWLNERQGWDVDNWSNGDTEVYRSNLGNCSNFKANGTAFAFKMIVSNQGAGFGSLRFWNDELCLDKMEFIVQAQKYTWEASDEEEENCWQNQQGPIKIATKNNM